MSREKPESANSLFFMALGADMIVTGLVAITDFWAVGVLNDIRSGISRADQSTINAMEFWESFAKVMILTMAAVGFALVRWLGACYEYAQTKLKASGFAQEGWKTWGWIVPFMNLFKPYQVLSEIYKVGVAERAECEEWKKSSGSGVLLAWWVFWVITHMIMWVIGKQALKSSFRDDLSLNQIIGMYYGSVTVCVISLVVAGLWFAVAGSLTRRLVSRSVADFHAPSVSVASAFPNAGASESTAKVQPPLSISIVDGSPAMTVPPKPTSSPNTVDEDNIYALIAEELEAGRPEKGLWTRLFAEMDGDEKRTKVAYIKQRAEKLLTAEQMRISDEMGRQDHERKAKSELMQKIKTGAVDRYEAEKSVAGMGTAYLAACKSGKISDLKRMTTERPMLLAVCDKDGNTGLHVAVSAGQRDVVTFLLEQGIYKHARTDSGVSALGMARQYGNKEIVGLLE